MNGVLVLDKPAGPTSHDMVDRVRRLLPGTRAGHTGTLDPFATGVLPVCLGRATRLARFLSATRKTYHGSIVLGTTTDTYDRDGRIVAENPLDDVDPEAVLRAVQRFLGTIRQTPPAFSARKLGGQRAHRLARRGKPVELEPSIVTIHAFRIQRLSLPGIEFEIECSAGTYIRSIAHDLGAALGCGGHLASLRRVKAGAFHVDQAYPPEALERAAMTGSLPALVVPMDRLDLGLPTVTVTTAGQQAMRHGRPLTRDDLAVLPPASHGPVRVQNQDGALIGIALPAGPASPSPPDSAHPADLHEAVLKPDIVLAG